MPFAGWSYEDVHTAWVAVLGDAAGGHDVSSYAAPARAEDLSGLPATYVEVGELDILRDESIDYARRIALAGIST
ncbi:MAG: Alpha/beta hydrolase fold-3 domain protein [Actinomycetia bacterium]|nr:Alpha/beta hydrolase fold-3 domain protein [Actinomycetes bacterium]